MSDHTDGGEPSTMDQSGSAWEYNAPQFVDFNSSRALDLNDEADAWFDQQANPEENFFSMPNTATPDVKKFHLELDDEEGEETDKSVYYETDPAEAPDEEGDEMTVDMQTPPKKRMRRATRDSTTSVSSMTSMTSTTSAPPRSNLVTSWGSNAKKTYPSAGLRKSRRNSLQEARDKMRAQVLKPVRRQTPKRTNAKTTEELELEKIEALRKRAQQAMKQSQKSMAVAQAGISRKRTHHEVQPATRPHEFHFQTDQRVKNHTMKTRQDETLKPEDFAKCLRSNRSLSRSKKPQQSGPTVPKPFHLTNPQVKPKKHEPGYKFHSDAEKMIRFQKDTPERFRSRPRNDPGQPHLEPTKHAKLTVPHTPNLVSRNRKRPITAISHAEMEEKEAEEVKKFKFRAHPVNTKIMEKEVGIPKVESKATTEFEEFNLRTEKKPLVQRNPPEEEEKYEFKAKPVPRNILDGAVGIKKAQPPPLTVPESPAFALKNRVRSVLPLDKTESEEVDRIVRANPVPHYGVAFQPKTDHKATVPAPFSFDERDKSKIKEKEEKITKIIEEEAKPHEFHAQPVPKYESHHDHIPKTKVKPVTVPEPFNLEGPIRSYQKQEELERLKEEEARELQEAAKFKARPATVVTKEPFLPKRTDKPLTEINEFELNTERRAVERDLYEERKHDKVQMLEQMNMERMRRHEEQEKQEVRDMRNAMVHKAQPIKHYKPVSIHPSDKLLTEPHSPVFSDRFKK